MTLEVWQLSVCELIESLRTTVTPSQLVLSWAHSPIGTLYVQLQPASKAPTSHPLVRMPASVLTGTHLLPLVCSMSSHSTS